MCTFVLVPPHGSLVSWMRQDLKFEKNFSILIIPGRHASFIQLVATGKRWSSLLFRTQHIPVRLTFAHKWLPTDWLTDWPTKLQHRFIIRISLWPYMACYAVQNARTAFSCLYTSPCSYCKLIYFGTVTRLLCTPADYIPTRRRRGRRTWYNYTSDYLSNYDTLRCITVYCWCMVSFNGCVVK